MQANNQHRILVVDDNPFNCDGVALYLESVGYTAFRAGDAETAYATAVAEKPDGAVVDIVIPVHPNGEILLDESVGIGLVKRLKELHPSMGVVVFSAYDDRGSEIWSLMRDGNRGLAYMIKGTNPERLLSALEETLSGSIVLDPRALTSARHLRNDIWQRLSDEERPWVKRAVELIPTLTERETEVAKRLASSQTLTGMADSLGITKATVENHITSVYAKLGLSTMDQSATSLRKSTLLAKAFLLYELGILESKE